MSAAASVIAAAAAKLSSTDLLAEVNRLRAQWAQASGDSTYSVIERRGSRYFCGPESYALSMSRAEVEEQIVSHVVNFQDYEGEIIGDRLRNSVSHSTIMAQHADYSQYVRLINGIARLPQNIRIEALAFNGVSTDDYKFAYYCDAMERGAR